MPQMPMREPISAWKPECVSDFIRSPYNRGTSADHDAVQQGS